MCNIKKCIVNFSGRYNGNCNDIAGYIKEVLDADVDIFDFYGVKATPCGNCNYECLDAADGCLINDEIADVYAALISADAIYFVVPNYINYPCANFWIFNERKQGVFGRKHDLERHYLQIKKKFVVVSNTEKDNFRQIFKSHVKGEPDILFLATRDFAKGGVRGGLMGDAQAQAILKEFIGK